MATEENALIPKKANGTGTARMNVELAEATPSPASPKPWYAGAYDKVSAEEIRFRSGALPIKSPAPGSR
jgi:hypothetical protein